MELSLSAALFPGTARIARQAASLKTEEELWEALHGRAQMHGEELLRHVPAHLLAGGEVISSISHEYLFAIACNLHLNRAIADRLIQQVLGEWSASLKGERRLENFNPSDILRLLALRGFPASREVLAPWVSRLRDKEAGRCLAYMLLDVPSPAVDEALLLKIWNVLRSENSAPLMVARHPSATPRVWTAVARQAIPRLRHKNRFLAAENRALLREIASQEEAASDPELFALLLKSGEAEVLAAILPHLSPAAFREGWSLAASDPRTSPGALVRLLDLASPAHLSALGEEDVARLLQHPESEVRTVGIRLFARQAPSPARTR